MSEKWGNIFEKLSDPVLWYSVGVAVLLVACILYSGALAAPYNTDGPSYAIAHESTVAFENYVEDSEELQEMSPVPVSDLSPGSQQAFNEMQSGNSQARWQQIGSVSVCHPSLIYCDEYENRPSFPTEYHDNHELYGLVEDDGDEYLVQTSSIKRLNFGPLLQMVFKVLILGPYAGFLIWSGFTRETGANRAQTTYATVGLGLAGAVLASPYFFMLTEYSPNQSTISTLAFVSWGTILAGIYLRLTSDSPIPR